MASCPSLCEIESDDIKQIGFILSLEGEEVTKALFYSDYIRRLVLQAEAELMKEGIRVVQGNATEDVTQDRRALRCHAGMLPKQVQCNLSYNKNRSRRVDGNNGSLSGTVVSEYNDPQWRNCFEPFVNPHDEYSRGELSEVD
ncbi:hypothetical protein NDU88_005405 [Pleurodeles waltl]|uniref:Uncharacterized protein n=1 Tax=Pleurodeles waltl TaxID=8319 RepID=A0AAV7SLQ1_PLEWA|nr:hypothetical protein NDU88_005405 [Pleurodeles waltl]